MTDLTIEEAVLKIREPIETYGRDGGFDELPFWWEEALAALDLLASRLEGLHKLYNQAQDDASREAERRVELELRLRACEDHLDTDTLARQAVRIADLESRLRACAELVELWREELMLFRDETLIDCADELHAALHGSTPDDDKKAPR